MDEGNVKYTYAVYVQGARMPQFVLANSIAEAVEIESELNPNKEIWAVWFVGWETPKKKRRVHRK